MHIVDANTLVGTTQEGSRGSLTLMPAHAEPNWSSQILIVPPGTKAPKQGNPLTSKTMLFVLQGSSTLSNGEYYQKITPGQLVVLEPGEERVFQTEKEKFVCLEVRLGPAAAPAPATTPTVAFIAKEEPIAEAAPKRSAAVYEEI